MSKIQHPIRAQEFVYYKHAGGPTPNIKREWIGFFSDYQNYPMYFTLCIFMGHHSKNAEIALWPFKIAQQISMRRSI
jgi:hypothetical protein